MTQWREEDGTSRSCSSDELMGILRTLDPVDSTSGGSRNKSASSASSINGASSAVSAAAGQNISSTNDDNDDPPHSSASSATSDVVNSTNHNNTEALTTSSTHFSSSGTSMEENHHQNRNNVDASSRSPPPCTSSSCEPSSSCSSTSTTTTATATAVRRNRESRVTTTTPDNNGVSESGCKDDSSQEPISTNNNVASSNSNFNCGSQRDKYANPIPLPAPPSCSIDVTVTSACGGNQSYIGYGLSNSTFQRLQDRPCSPTFGTTRPMSHVFTPSPYIPPRPPGVVGLDNLGNTCFMNSGLQCLINTPRIVQYFLSGDISLSNICPREKALVTEFQTLIRCAWWGTSNKISPREFKDVLGNVLVQFSDGRQHDCQEFLVAMLDVLHEQLKLWNKQVNECGSSTITTSGRSDSSSGVYSGWASDTDISSSQTSPGETNLEASASSPQTKRRRLDVLESEESHLEPKCSTSEEFKGVISEDSGAETLRLGDVDANLDVEEEEVVLGLDINHENDELPEPVEVDGSNEVDSTSNLLKKADDFWNNYLLENNTVIANSFQGMYKSTVKCSTCEYVSLTYEPFMYLPLQIPTVVERKIDVTFSSVVDCRPKKVSVTVGVGETVGKLKEQVVGKIVDDSVWGIPLSTYVVAEVVNNAICRLLNDDILLKYVYDGNRNIYVFELNQDFDDLSSAVYGSSIDDCNSNKPSYSFVSYQPELRPMTYLEEDWEVPDSPNQIVQGPLPNPVNYLEQQSSVNYEHQTPVEEIDTQETDVDPRGTESIGDVPVNVTIHDGGGAEFCCSVCLEDFPKPSLRQHYGCSCLLCVDCMTKTATHYDPPNANANNEGKEDAGSSAKNDKNKLLKCPVCSEILNYEETFLPLSDNNEAEGAPPKLNQIPLLFRHELESDSNNNSPSVSKLFFFPWVVKLPSAIPAVELYTFISKINPFPEHTFKLVSLSWDGKQCNSCVYTMSCKGCEIPMDGVISISPKSSIAISYTNLPPDFVETVEPSDMAKSNLEYYPTGLAKEDPNVDIYECLSAFSEIEHLDATWNCPRCKVNREATKALSICKVPDYLIVYLKRFVFMDQMSSKLNTRLMFPLNDLDLKSFIAEEFRGADEIKGVDNMMFDLYACVCHFGSSSAGHYTAYAKNPESNQWNQFNDQTVSSKTPSDEEFTSAYVLFYARKGYKCDIPQRHMIPSCVQTSNLCNKSDSTSPSEESGNKDTFSNRSPISDAILCDSTSVMDQEESSSLQTSS